MSSRVALLALAALVFAAYGCTLTGGYLADDYLLLAELVAEDGHVAIGDVLGGLFEPLGPEVEARFFRPVWRASYLLDVMVLAAEPLASRVFDLLLHVANCTLLFTLVDRLLGDRRVALLGAALFAVFPRHPEAVVWVAARVDLLAQLFTLAALNVYARALQAAVSHRARAATVLLAVAAMGCKETGFLTVPFVTLLHAASLARGPLVERVAAAFRRTWWLWLVLLGFVALRWHVVGSLLGGGRSQRTTGLLHGGWGAEKAGQLAELAFPVTVGWGRGDHEILAAAVVAALLLVGLLVVKSRRPRAAYALALLWVVASLGVLHGLAVAEPGFHARFMYQPALAWCPLVAAAALACVARARRGWPVVAVAVLVVGVAWLFLWRSLLPYRAAGGTVRAVVEDARATLRQATGPTVLHGIPDRFGAALLGRNALPWAAWPPFTPRRPRPFIALTDTELGAVDFTSATYVSFVMSPGVTYLAWDDAGRAFVAAGPAPLFVRTAGVVERTATGFRLQPPAVELLGATAELAAFVGQHVAVRGRLAPGRGDALRVASIRRRRPDLEISGWRDGVLVLVARGQPRDAVHLMVSARRAFVPTGTPGTLLVGDPVLAVAATIADGDSAAELRLVVPPRRRQPLRAQLLVRRGDALLLGDAVAIP